MREGTDQYDDGKGGFSYAEKLALVAQGMMAPESIGLSSQEQAYKEITGEEELSPKLGDFVTFEASTIPSELRAHWACDELKVKPSGFVAKEWEAKWVEEHKDEYAVQGTLHSGTCHATLQRLYSDPIIGFVEMIRQAADLLEAKYNDLKKTDPNPIITRTDKRAIASASQARSAQAAEQQKSE